MKFTRIILAVSLMMVLAGPGMLEAQVYVQQGNVMDANPQTNSGGLNSGTRYSGYQMGNRIVSGNVGGGASFRGYSPIRDPSSLFFTNYAQPLAGAGVSGVSNSGLATYTAGSGLPSDRLYGFNRSSVSIANARAGYIPGSLSRTPYYSSSTVANTGAIIAGLNRPGSSQLLTPYGPARPTDARLLPNNPLDTSDTGVGSLLGVSSRLVRIDNGQSLTGSINPRLAGSRLFGAVREVPLDSLVSQARRNEGGASTLLAQPTGREGPPSLIQPRPTVQPGQQDQPANDHSTPGQGQGAAAGNPSGYLATSVKTGTLANADDVYGLMRSRNSTLSRRLTAPGPTGVAGGRDTDGKTPAVGANPPSPPDEEDSLGPLRTFVGTQNSLLNTRLSEGEGFLKQGQYYRAAESYSQAQAVDPTNPLPHLGRSVSLLAAGDYMSSATAMYTAIRLFDSLGRFQIDLKAFVPEAGVLENRRADLEKRLQLFDDFRLRFLLGYLQYSTGLPDAGLANMEAATQKSPAEFQAVGRFVADLRAKRHTAPATQPAGG
jgi:hypothetical protein